MPTCIKSPERLVSKSRVWIMTRFGPAEDECPDLFWSQERHFDRTGTSNRIPDNRHRSVAGQVEYGTRPISDVFSQEIQVGAMHLSANPVTPSDQIDASSGNGWRSTSVTRQDSRGCRIEFGTHALRSALPPVPPGQGWSSEGALRIAVDRAAVDRAAMDGATRYPRTMARRGDGVGSQRFFEKLRTTVRTRRSGAATVLSYEE